MLWGSEPKPPISESKIFYKNQVSIGALLVACDSIEVWVYIQKH